MAFHTKVKLILKWPFGVYQETNEKFLRISALALKFLYSEMAKKISQNWGEDFGKFGGLLKIHEI